MEQKDRDHSYNSLAIAAGEQPSRPPIIKYNLDRVSWPPSEAIRAAIERNEIVSSVAEGDGLPETWFDYSVVAADKHKELHEIVSRVKAASRTLTEQIIRIGGDLIKAKAILGHGNFLPWLQAEFRWSERTARRYMTVAEHFGAKSATVSDLPARAAYELSKLSTPPAVRQDVMRRLEAGEHFTHASVVKEIEAAIPPGEKAAQEKAKAMLAATKKRDFESMMAVLDQQCVDEKNNARVAAEMVRDIFNPAQLKEFVELIAEASIAAFRTQVLNLLPDSDAPRPRPTLRVVGDP
jgi:hypothetical protein